MSGNSTVLSAETAGVSGLIPALRYAAGSAVIMLVAMSADYTLSYLTPVLALNFLAPGTKAPTLKSSAIFLISIALASISGVLFTRFFLEYPLVFIPLLILVMFHIYYTTSLQKMKVWLIISLLLIPMVSMESASMGSLVAVNLFINAALAVILVRLVYFIFPAGETAYEEKKAPSPIVSASNRQRYLYALKTTLVVLPVLVLFFVFNWSNALLVLIFISILSMNPATSNKKAGLAIIAANLGGGLAAIVAFNLLTIVPSIIFLGMLVLLTGLFSGPGVFSGKPVAVVIGMAFSTFLLILGNVTSFRGEAGEEVWTRILQLGIVVVYMVIAFGTVNRFSMFRTSKPEIQAV